MGLFLPSQGTMNQKKKPVSKEIQELIDEFFKGHKVLDEEAFTKALERLGDEDKQLLQDLRDAAFEHDEEPEEAPGAKRRRGAKKKGSNPITTRNQ